MTTIGMVAASVGLLCGVTLLAIGSTWRYRALGSIYLGINGAALLLLWHAN